MRRRPPLVFLSGSLDRGGDESGYDITGWWWYGTGTLPYWLLLRDGVVVQAEEWYLP